MYILFKMFYRDVLRPAVQDSVFSSIVNRYPESNASSSISLCLGGKRVDVMIIQAYSCPKDGSGRWYTESVCIPFTVLEGYGVPVRKFVYGKNEDGYGYRMDRDK